MLNEALALSLHKVLKADAAGIGGVVYFFDD